MNLSPEEHQKIRSKSLQAMKSGVDEVKRDSAIAYAKANFEATFNGFVALMEFIDGKVTKTEVINQIKSVSTPDVEKLISPLASLLAATKENKLDISPLAAVMGEVVSELKLLPKEHPESPEAPEDVKINNLSELDDKFASLENAFKGLKLVVPAPEVKVNVPKQEIKTETVDLEPLSALLSEMIETFKLVEYPESVFETSDLLEALDKSNKLLDKLVKKPTGGGGGGGGGSSFTRNGLSFYVEAESDGSIPVTIKNTSGLLLIEGFETTTGITANADVTSITTSTTHLGQGSYSLSFAKSGTATNFALIEKTLTSVDITEYSGTHDIEWKLYLSSVANISTVYVALGSGLFNNYFWEVPVSELKAGWNMPQRPVEEPTGQIGAGADLATITWMGVFIGFNSAANTLSGILVDNIELHPAELHRTESIVGTTKKTDSYGIQAISNDGTYKYFFFENDDTNYYILRKNLTTSVFSYAKGTGSYTTVYQSATLGPSGSPTWGTKGETF